MRSRVYRYRALASAAIGASAAWIGRHGARRVPEDAPAMIHVVTVHWQDDRWIAPQLRFLDRFLPAEHRTYAALNGIDPALGRRFSFAADLDGKHPEKLNRLAEIAREHADPEDLLLFVDGDAFPIAAGRPRHPRRQPARGHPPRRERR